MVWTKLGLQLLKDADNFYDPSSVNNDYFQAEHHNITIMANRGNHVISGLEVTEEGTPSLSIVVSGGSAYVDGVLDDSISLDTIDLTAEVPADGGKSVYVLVYVYNNTGTLTIATLTGDDATTGTQFYPEMPEDAVALGIVVLTNGDTTIDNVDIGDMRIFIPDNLYTPGEVRYDAQLVSTIATGTAPFVLSSTTLVANLNADLLDGQEGSYYSPTSHNHSATYQPLDSDLTTISAITKVEDGFIVAGASNWEQKTPSQVKAILDLEIGSDVQAYSTHLSSITGFTKTDGGFIVANGSTYVLETGSTVRSSLGLGTSDSPQYAGLHLTGSLNANGLATISMTEMSYLDGVTSSIQTQIGGNDTDIAANLSSIGTINTTLGDLQTQITSNDTDIGNNATAIGNNATAIGNNATDIGDNDTYISSLDGRVTTLEGGGVTLDEYFGIGLANAYYVDLAPGIVETDLNWNKWQGHSLWQLTEPLYLGSKSLRIVGYRLKSISNSGSDYITRVTFKYMPEDDSSGTGDMAIDNSNHTTNGFRVVKTFAELGYSTKDTASYFTVYVEVEVIGTPSFSSPQLLVYYA